VSNRTSIKIYKFSRQTHTGRTYLPRLSRQSCPRSASFDPPPKLDWRHCQSRAGLCSISSLSYHHHHQHYH